MNATSNKHTGLLETLIPSGWAFALFRLPEQSQPVALFLPNHDVETLDRLSRLDSEPAFLIAPFKNQPSTPIVRLRSTGWILGMEAIRTAAVQNARIKHPVATGHTATEGNQSTTRTQYAESFANVQACLQQGHCNKVVLSKCEVLPRPESKELLDFFQDACIQYPEAFVCLFHTAQSGTWLFSSPELLYASNGNQSSTCALAGTIAAGRKDETTQWSDKNSREQEWVRRYVDEVLQKHQIPTQQIHRESVRAGDLMHIKTTYRFATDSIPSLGLLLEDLHPTPATGGYPKKEALQCIEDCETHHRGYYTGFAGPIGFQQNKHLYVNLRCMQLLDKNIQLFTGGGILPESQPGDEWHETNIKLNTMKALL